MNISEPFIRRPVMTTLLMVGFLFFGILAYRLLPVSSLPPISYPTIQVSANYPGASPETMADLIAGPLERELITMQGIRTLSSSNTYQTTTILCQFYLDVDVNVAAQEVQEAINEAMGNLPSDLPENPTYVKANPSDTPIIYLVAHSDVLTAGDLYDYGYTYIGQQIGTVEGVALVNTYGYPRAVRINVDPQALAAKNISLQDVANALDNENPNIPTGTLYGPNTSIITQVDGQIPFAKGYESLIIKYQDGTPVRLRDIGYAEDSVQNDKQPRQWMTKHSTESLVVLAAYHQPGYNTVDVCNHIIAMVNQLKADLPASVVIDIPYSQSWWISQAIQEVEFTLVLSFVLVAGVILFYLGKVRNTIIPIITLPITLMGTFAAMYMMGFTLDILSLSALTLSMGFLVDDAIVVLENVVRWVQGGEKPFTGAIKASRQISSTILSISLCIAIVFIPMAFMGGVIGKLFNEFAIVIIIAVIFSGFISLTLTPMLSSRFVSSYTSKKNKLELLDEKMHHLLVRRYVPLLDWALGHKTLTTLIACGCLGLSIFLLAVLPSSFLPVDDLGVIECFPEAKPGTSPEKMSGYLDELTQIAIKSPYVETVGRIDSTPTDNQAIFFLNLSDINKRPSVEKVMQEMREEFSKVIGVNVFMKPFTLINLQVGSLSASKAQYQYLLQGINQQELYSSATQLIDKLRSYPQFSQVTSDLSLDSPYLRVKILRDQAHAYAQSSAADVENVFKYAYGETYVSKINMPENLYYVILQTAPQYYRDPSDLSLLYLGPEQKTETALQAVISTEMTSGPLMVNHTNALPSVTISFDVKPEVPLSEGLNAIYEASDEILPKNIRRQMIGTAQVFESSFRQLGLLMVVAILAIYLILGILYENFIHPITALSAIPVAALGALITLFILGESVSLYAAVGILMLLGIVMKNGILIIEFALELIQEQGKSPLDAVKEACVIRFRPILMTTLAATMGALPVALGIGGTEAHGRAPLGQVIVGGLIFSQVVTLFITPVVFLVVCNLQDFFTKRFPMFKARPDIEPAETEEEP